MLSMLCFIVLCIIWVCDAEKSELLVQQIENQCLGSEYLGWPTLWFWTNRRFNSILIFWASSLGSLHWEHTLQFLPGIICSVVASRLDSAALVAVSREDSSVVAHSWKSRQWCLYWDEKLRGTVVLRVGAERSEVLTGVMSHSPL